MSKQKKIFAPCKIRLLKEEDIACTASIFAEAFNSAKVGENWTPEMAEKYVRYWLERQPDLFIVAVCEGQIAGGAVAEIKPWWDGFHLAEGELFVHPKFQGRGIGAELLKGLLERGINNYGEIVEFEGIANGKAEFPMNWYEKIGIKRTGWVHVAGEPRDILGRLG
jgi:GNAT superfamily N-acetyltransferase